jgi:aspartyl-tRNA(Asn)/glutamyl-tRNA(Gln) amidotransferase subunit B
MNTEAVIGLEVHVQVKTRSKMFSRVASGYGEPENTLTDPVVLALPGALPVMNKAALDAVIKAGLMLGCEIAPVCKWDRKNYFYPDSPKNYQISQYDQPICRGGSVEIELPGPARNVMGEHKRIPLTRIHLEEDVGKLTHDGSGSLVDFNRAGTPLMEIVSEPAIHTPEEAFAYLTALKAIMVYGGISDCDMEKGQLRCDANVSIRPAGSTGLGTKVELKNLNSISFVRDGIAHEIRRQQSVLASGGTIVQETRDYDGQTGASQSLRSKEMAHDYRYFPDPDLMPVVVDEAWKASLPVPELPFDKQKRFLEAYKVPYTITSVLVPDRELSEYFEEVAKRSGEPQLTGNWIINTCLQFLNEGRVASVAELRAKLSPERAAGLISQRAAGAIPSTAMATVSSALLGTDLTAAQVAEREGLNVRADARELETWCREAIAANPKSLADFKAGKDSAINGFKGSVMRAAKGKADPRLVDETLRRLLAAS